MIEPVKEIVLLLLTLSNLERYFLLFLKGETKCFWVALNSSFNRNVIFWGG